jgi:predicted  nucleic acid-binding Zn-ribbon protein
MSNLKKVYDLQRLVLQKKQNQKELAENISDVLQREKVTILKSKEYVKEKLINLKNMDEKLLELNQELDKEEIELKDLEKKLYADHTTLKEINFLEEKLQSLKDKTESLTENILAKQEEKDKFYKRVYIEQNNYQAMTDNFKKRVEEYKEKRENLKLQLFSVETEIRNLTEEIEPSLLKNYLKLAPKYQGKVISKVKNNSCSVCRMLLSTSQLNEVKNRELLVICENCGRILYWE